MNWFKPDTTASLRLTGRAALARILAAIDAGAPEPTAIANIDMGADISYHRGRPGHDSLAEAAAMVRALGIAAEPTAYRHEGYHSIMWESWEGGCRWAVTAFVDGEAQS